MSGTNPKLVFPADIQIRQINTTNDDFDDILEENQNHTTFDTAFTISAQIVYKKDDDTRDRPNYIGPEGSGLGGLTLESMGYVLLLYKDLTTAGKTLRQGDKIIKLAQLTVDYRITGFRPAGQKNGEFRILQAFFTDRNPT